MLVSYAIAGLIAVVMVFSLAFILVNIFIDGFVVLIDPRIRYRA